MKPALPLITALLLCALAGCGFHLPNQTRISDSLRELNVQGDYHDPFYKKVVRALEISGITVNAQFSRKPEEPLNEQIPTLIIPRPKVRFPLASINANAKALEYDLIAVSTTTLRVPNHRPIIMRNTLTRTVLNKPGYSMASANERAILRDETYDELAAQLVTRLSYLGRQSDPDAPVISPAQLVEEGASATLRTVYDAAAGMTLLEALQYADELERAESVSVSLDELNNAGEILGREYRLPSVAPRPADDASAGPEPGDFDIMSGP